MGSNSASPGSKPKSSSKTLLVIAILLVVVCIPLGLVVNFMLNFSQMSPHEQSFFRAIGADLRRGNLGLTTARATAQRNAQESNEKMKQSHGKEDEADREYQQALEEQRSAVAKYKAKKELPAKKPAAGAVTAP